MPNERIQVEQVRAEDVYVGDLIWAQNDNDWLRVADMDAGSWGGSVFYREDKSLAEFEDGATILRKVS
jgi:outer membrane protein assembly factor BamB